MKITYSVLIKRVYKVDFPSLKLTFGHQRKCYTIVLPCGNLVGSVIGTPSMEQSGAFGKNIAVSPSYSTTQCSLTRKKKDSKVVFIVWYLSSINSVNYLKARSHEARSISQERGDILRGGRGDILERWIFRVGHRPRTNPLNFGWKLDEIFIKICL